MRWLLTRIVEWLRPRPGHLGVEFVVPLRESRVRQIIDELPAGSAGLPGAVVSARDAGPGRSEVAVVTRIPAGRTFLNLAAPWILPALQRKAMTVLFPSLGRIKSPAGILDYFVLIPFKADKSCLGPPYVSRLARYALQLHLTQKPIPFEENAVHFCVLEQAEIRTESTRQSGFVYLPVTRHTVFWKGSGGVLERHADRMELGLCDERQAIAARCALKLEKPFGRGSILPAAAQTSRTIFQGAPGNLHVEISEETLERAANEIWFLEIQDGKSSLESFLTDLIGVRAILDGPAVLLPRVKMERTVSKLVSITDLIF